MPARTILQSIATLVIPLLAACTGDSKESDDTSGSGRHTSGETGDTPREEDSGATETPTQAVLAVLALVDVGRIEANNTEGESVLVSGSMSTEGAGNGEVAVLAYVDPGTWTVTAFDPTLEACNMANAGVLVAGDTFDWTLSEFPGVADGTACAIPEE